jgi:hypothetical protein
MRHKEFIRMILIIIDLIVDYYSDATTNSVNENQNHFLMVIYKRPSKAELRIKLVTNQIRNLVNIKIQPMLS